MKTKYLKISKQIAIILLAVFTIAGIVACGGNSNVTGSDLTQASDSGKIINLTSDLPSWGVEYQKEFESTNIEVTPSPTPEPTSYYVVRYASSGSRFDKATLDLVAKTDNLQIYVEDGYTYSRDNIVYVATKFENNYKQMTNIYGTHTDMDKNGKIKLFFVNINLNNNSDVVATGYFLPNDLIYGSANNGEILYMDINLLNSNPRDIAGTVLHEFQHLINFNVNDIQKQSSMSLWLNESLSESTSILFDSYVAQSRINEFNKINYYCFYTWNLPSSYGFINYPSASVFMNWLYNKNGRNSDIFKKIASSSQAQDYNKVLKSVSSGSTWQNLLTDWISGVKNGQVSGVYIRNRSSATLYPGAAIYDGSQVRVNPSTELANPSRYTVTVSKANTTSGRSAINNDEVETSLQNNSGPKYIDLVFDRDGKIRKY